MLLIIDKSLINVFKEVDNTKIYNFNTLHEGLLKAEDLFVLSDVCKDMNVYGTREFDVAYAELIFNNNDKFKSLFNIIYDLYRNINICIAVDFDNHGEYMSEALTKIIQQRYEYDATYIYEYDDIPSLKDIEQEFGITGLYNFDGDRKRYFEILSKEELKRIKLENKEINNGNK